MGAAMLTDTAAADREVPGVVVDSLRLPTHRSLRMQLVAMAAELTTF